MDFHLTTILISRGTYFIDFYRAKRGIGGWIVYLRISLDVNAAASTLYSFFVYTLFRLSEDARMKNINLHPYKEEINKCNYSKYN